MGSLGSQSFSLAVPMFSFQYLRWRVLGQCDAFPLYRTGSFCLETWKCFSLILEFRSFMLRCLSFLFFPFLCLPVPFWSASWDLFFKSLKSSSIFKLLPLFHLCLFVLLELIHLNVRTTGSILQVSNFPLYFHLFVLFALCFEVFFPLVLPSH